MVKLSIFATANDSRVDAENGILRGVRVITKGEAKGHSFLGEPIIVDDQTLAEVASAASAFADGVPVKLAHGTDIEELVGSVRNISQDTDCVRGDLYLLKNHESYATIMEMAETMPSNFGLSISFMNAPEAIKGADMEPDGDEDDIDASLRNLVGDDIVAYAARVCELYSCDLVQSPACNPSLFSIPMSETNATPEPVEQDSEIVEEIPASELPAETLQEVAEEVGVDASEIETVGVVADAESIEKEEASPEATEAVIPAPAELSRNWNAVTTELASVRSELDTTRTELASVKSDLEAARASVSIKDAQLVELNMLHRAVLSVMNLGASIEIPESGPDEVQESVAEKYSKMPAGPARLAFFEQHKNELFNALNGKK